MNSSFDAGTALRRLTLEYRPPGGPQAQPSSATQPGPISLWLADLDQYAALHPLVGLPASEQQRAERMATRRLAQRSLARRHLLRHLLGQSVSRSPQSLEIVADALGKPRLADGPPFFSLSHREHLALLGLHAALPIGVDIELLRPVGDLAAMSQATFSARECDEQAALPADARERHFLSCWTRKEAVVKALGVGLGAPLREIDVGGEGGGPLQPAGLAPVTLSLAVAGGLCEVHLQDLRLPTGIAAVAAVAWTDAVSVERAHAAWR